MKEMKMNEFYNLACDSFIHNTKQFLEFPQPFRSYDEMIRTASRWHILNTSLPCSPKEKNIIGDTRRWIYVVRAMAYFLEQIIKEKQGQPSEWGKAYNLTCSNKPIRVLFFDSWKIDYDSTFNNYSIVSNLEFCENWPFAERILRVSKESVNILERHIDYFKQLAPFNVVEKWSYSFGSDTLYVEP